MSTKEEGLKLELKAWKMKLVLSKKFAPDKSKHDLIVGNINRCERELQRIRGDFHK